MDEILDEAEMACRRDEVGLVGIFDDIADDKNARHRVMFQLVNTNTNPDREPGARIQNTNPEHELGKETRHMMDYNSFKEQLETSLAERLGAGYTVEEIAIGKNNGTAEDALMVRKGEGREAALLYPDDLFRDLKGGTSLDEILNEAEMVCRRGEPGLVEIFDDIADYKNARHRVMFQLVNTKLNEGLLVDVPSVPLLDLSVVFRLFVKEKGSGEYSLLVTNELAEGWGVTAKDLYGAAAENMPRLHPPVVATLYDKLAKMGIMGPDGKAAYDGAYVLTAKGSGYGAAAILYPGMLDKMAGMVRDDCVILPSSVQELIITRRKHWRDVRGVNGMIRSINSSHVRADDVLSDHAYVYLRKERKLRNFT